MFSAADIAVEAANCSTDGALGGSGEGRDMFVDVKEDTSDEDVVDAVDTAAAVDGFKFCNDVASMSFVTMLRFISAIAAIT